MASVSPYSTVSRYPSMISPTIERPRALVNTLELPVTPPVEEHFLDPKYSVSSSQAMSYFTGGFLLAFAGRGMLSHILSKSQKSPQKAFQPGTLEKQKVGEQEFSVFQNYNEALSSIYRLMQFDPTQGNALLMYVSTAVLGYLSGNVIQGAKESWVRQQESVIRAALIDRLQTVVRQSIRTKNDFDNQYKEQVRNRLFSLLTMAGIVEPASLIQEVPIIEPLSMRQHYFYEPTHRTIQFGSDGPGINPVNGASLTESETKVGWQKALIFGLGAFSGLVLNGFLKLLLGSKKEGPNSCRAKVSEGLMLKDKESWAMIGVKSYRNFGVMAGFFSMSAAAALGKIFLDGLREIEVTRLNARTELDYQTHNWLTQDPLFHNIAEQETVENELSRLAIDLPALRYNRPLLKQKVQTILSNIGRNSAPPYYPMTPTVGLVEARA